MSEMLNDESISLEEASNVNQVLFQRANIYTDIWSKLLWVSGGSINIFKCFYYFIDPTHDFQQGKNRYRKLSSMNA